MSNILDGKKIAKKIRNEIKLKIRQLLQQGKRAPQLAVVLVGNDPASEVYIANKTAACVEVGMQTKQYALADTTSMDELLALINELNSSSKIDGILVQLPLPQHMDLTKIIEHINPDKDVDGFHPFNFGRLAQGIPHFKPCTAAAVDLLLQETKVELAGLHATIIGNSNIAGKPSMLELTNKGVTTTCCHKYTKDLASQVKGADIVIAAVGKPHLIPANWLKDGAIVIDIGINRTATGKLIGDVDSKGAAAKLSWYTPVPGGVGPITVAMLLENTLKAYYIQQ